LRMQQFNERRNVLFRRLATSQHATGRRPRRLPAVGIYEPHSEMEH
jgi:hypothetical protein